MLFVVPLVFSVAAVVYFWTTDIDVKWKVVAAAVVTLSLCFQFVPPMKTHFLVPLIMQVLVCLWMIFHQKMN
jgi:hypothetical protein